MSKRIWSESTLRWDAAGAELWNIIKSYVSRGNDGDGEADWMDFEDEEIQRMQPTIVMEDLNPNLSPSKKRLLEIAGISRNFAYRKEVRDDVSIFITEAKFRTK